MKEKNLYFIKDGPNFNLCPLCNYPLSSCNLGAFCSHNKCPYVDGIAWLTDEETIKFKDKIQI